MIKDYDPDDYKFSEFLTHVDVSMEELAELLNFNFLQNNNAI